MASQIKLRRDSAANWETNNTVILAEGEIGVDLTSGKFKLGNGTSTWAALSYFQTGAGEGGVSNYNDLTNLPTIPTNTNQLTNGAGFITGTDRLVNGAKEIVLGANGSLTVPSPISAPFPLVFSAANYVSTEGKPTLTLTDTPWALTGQYAYAPDGRAALALDNIWPTVTNPGYTSGDAFEFDETVHGIPGFILTITLNDVVLPGGAGWTANVAESAAPVYAPTIESQGAVKLTANTNSFVFGTDGSITLPLGGDIVDSTGASVLGGVSTGDWAFSGNAAYNGTSFDQGLYVAPGGEGVSYIFVPGNSQSANTALQLSNGSSTGQVSVTAYNKNWQFDSDGNLTLPQGGDIKDSQGNSVLGGAAGPVQPYLELTNEPSITQPVILGTPVTVTAAPEGAGAQVVVTITEGSVLDSITIFEPGTGYTVGQNYIIYSYQIGGPAALDSLTLTIDTVDENSGILTVTNVQFLGAPQNVAGVYVTGLNYQASVFDAIDTGMTLTRDLSQGIYNSAVELEYDNNTYLSPLGTEWNSEGWGDLLELGTRTYTTWRQALNNQVGNNILASELVMHDIANDKYYKFDFTVWGGNNGSYAYTRTEVTDPNYFRKPHNADLGDVIKENSPEGTGIVIVRTSSAGIHNFSQEEGYSDANSPLGTTWNADGWDDLSNLTTRTYTSFYLATGQNINDVLGKKFVMYVAALQKYYAIEFLEWATNGDNNFAYTRKEIDQTKLNEGIAFPDGTKLKSALGVGRVKSTASGNRRIEEATGYNEVAVTARVTNNYTGLTSQTTNGYELRVARTPELDAVFLPINQGSVNATFTLSYDNVTYRAVWLSSIQETEYWFYYEQDFGQTTPQTENDPVYIRTVTGADPVIWWDKADLPGGSNNFRGAVIDYHAYTGESTIIGTIHIIDDDGEEHISHQEVQSGSSDGDNDDLWLVTQEGQIKYRRIDGESKTLKIHWTAKVFYGQEYYD